MRRFLWWNKLNLEISFVVGRDFFSWRDNFSAFACTADFSYTHGLAGGINDCKGQQFLLLGFNVSKIESAVIIFGYGDIGSVWGIRFFCLSI